MRRHTYPRPTLPSRVLGAKRVLQDYHRMHPMIIIRDMYDVLEQSLRSYRKSVQRGFSCDVPRDFNYLHLHSNAPGTYMEGFSGLRSQVGRKQEKENPASLPFMSQSMGSSARKLAYVVSHLGPETESRAADFESLGNGAGLSAQGASDGILSDYLSHLEVLELFGTLGPDNLPIPIGSAIEQLSVAPPFGILRHIEGSRKLLLVAAFRGIPLDLPLGIPNGCLECLGFLCRSRWDERLLRFL